MKNILHSKKGVSGLNLVAGLIITVIVILIFGSLISRLANRGETNAVDLMCTSATLLKIDAYNEDCVCGGTIYEKNYRINKDALVLPSSTQRLFKGPNMIEDEFFEISASDIKRIEDYLHNPTQIKLIVSERLGKYLQVQSTNARPEFFCYTSVSNTCTFDDFKRDYLLFVSGETLSTVCSVSYDECKLELQEICNQNRNKEDSFI